MIIDSFNKNKLINKMNIVKMLLFGLAVSIDSFSIGIGILNISNNYILCSIIFSLVSFSFTFVGLLIGDKLNQLFGNIATLFGGIVLLVLGISFTL